MKKISIIFLIIFSLGFYLVRASSIEKINIKLNNQIGVVFLNPNMLLILSEDESTLLIMDNDKFDNINKFKYKNLNVLALKKDLIKFNSKQSIILDHYYEIDNVKYLRQDGLIYINYKKTNLCISMDGGKNISSCQVVYFYNNDVKNILLHESNEVIIYNYKKPLPINILERMYEESIDIHPLREDTMTILKLNDEDYELIVIDNE